MEISLRLSQDSLEIEITPESLARYVDHTGADGLFTPDVEAIGWQLVAYCHGNRMEDYSDLRAVCELTGMRTIREFDEAMKQLNDIALEYASSAESVAVFRLG